MGDSFKDIMLGLLSKRLERLEVLEKTVGRVTDRPESCGSICDVYDKGLRDGSKMTLEGVVCLLDEVEAKLNTKSAAENNG